MSQSAIREHDGKKLLFSYFNEIQANQIKFKHKSILIGPETDISIITNPFKLHQKLVVKPDQLIKRRGKLGLVSINKTWEECLSFIKEKRKLEITIGKITDRLEFFIIEPFIAHSQEEELYVCINSKREGDEILFFHEGGVDIGDVDSKSSKMLIPVGDKPMPLNIKECLLQKVKSNKSIVAEFICTLFHSYCALHFAYLEINPLVVLKNNLIATEVGKIHILDLAAKLDQTASFQCHSHWTDLSFPPQFGHLECEEEAYIKSLDNRTGASLKLTVMNPKGRIWTLVAGGGASVIYADTICDLAGTKELGNYGEYSGAPTESLTYEYSHTVIRLMLKHPHPKGKILIIGGGIANFTNIADTFKGICRALKDNKIDLLAKNTTIYVRRGGPNYEKGLEMMRDCLLENGLPGSVHGPEDHITNIVARALGCKIIENLDAKNITLNQSFAITENNRDSREYFSKDTKCLVYGMQLRAVQGMLDFDYISRREKPSVCGIVYTFASGIFYRQLWFGGKEILLPVYPDLQTALEKHSEVDTIVNFASSRSVYISTKKIMKFDRIRNIAIIAEGVPERETKKLIRLSKSKGVNVIGPATVGGIFPGRFKIGNTGGMLSNQLASKLHRPGSVAYVSRSGGLSNELNNIISKYTDGVHSGVAIGGDRYPITTYMDHLLKFQNDPKVKILVLLGEVGGILEYDVIEAIKKGKITKPVVAWCTGTVASSFTYDVQFGHAGALAGCKLETAKAKNEALAKVGCFVPKSFQEFAALLGLLYKKMVTRGWIIPVKEVKPPLVPVDFQWAKKIGAVRKSSMFMSSISDERGEELLYGGMPISKVIKNGLGIGGTLGLLWFRRLLPEYFCRFIETILIITADHGPAVSGAHNTIVTARAGKDLISSLVTGLLTIGPRFGGALDEAAKEFHEAYKSGVSPIEFVRKKHEAKQLIMGIGHKIKSLENPDKRVEIIVEFAKVHFQNTKILDYGLSVQGITTRKKSNLILNVDGAIACCFVDIILSCDCFSSEEADQYIDHGVLNGLFVLGRSIGFIGHYLDQRRLNQGLYRHPTDDISYLLNV